MASKQPADKKPTRAAKPAQKSEPVERTFVNANTGKEGKPKAAPRERATGKRIGAVVCWVAAIAFEVLAILLLNGTLYIPGNLLTWLIVCVVIDLVLVIIGSQLWKRANRCDPASEANAVKFFLWNNMGVIASVLAFFPIIFLFLKSDELDAKSKRICTIVAALAMVAAVGTSIDYSPVSQEDLAAAESQAETLGDGTVYWTRWGKSYHLDPNCPHLLRSSVIYQGSMEEAFAANRTDPCDYCASADAAAVAAAPAA